MSITRSSLQDAGFSEGGGSGAGGGGVVSFAGPPRCTPLPFPREHTCSGEPGLWGKALQMSLWFFNVNKSGPGVLCTDTQWRGDAHLSDGSIRLASGDPNGVDMSEGYIERHRHVLDPDGDGALDLSGGYYDAGDFIKFAITQGYMASTVAWSMLEFREAYARTGLEQAALEQVRWAADFFMRATFVEDRSLPAEQWNVVAYAHQVSDASDHSCGWMPPELRSAEDCPRKAYFATHANPAADVTANNAAALAQIAMLTRDTDPAYSEDCLKHAIALYGFASRYPTSKGSASGGLYTSEYGADDLAWAASWLYEATGDEAYLDEAMTWVYDIPGFSKGCVDALIRWDGVTEDNACWFESWCHIWNSLRSGVFVRLAKVLSEAGSEYAPLFRMIARNDSMAWVEGPASPQGFAQKVAVSWGSGRYNSAGQLVALVYAKSFPDDPDSQRIVDWAARQARYLLGDNEVNGDPEGKSFMMGFTELSPNTPLEPHHAAGHASIYGEPDIPEANRHILWGALVNGPSSSDAHEDNRADYGGNEVTVDYNAAWVGALAGNAYFQAEKDGGWCPDPDFPPAEPPADEFYTMARINSLGSCRTQVSITMVNESVHPPRFNEHLTVRYYFDATELMAAGVDPSSVTARIAYDNTPLGLLPPTRISGPFPCEGDYSFGEPSKWYFVLDYTGQRFWGRQVRLHGPRTTLIDIGVPNSADCTWAPSNDHSFMELGDEEKKTPRITAYGEGGELLWGVEPECGWSTILLRPEKILP